MVFATDPDTSGSVSEVPYLAPDLESVELYNIAEQISDTKATTYTTTDIYNLLNSIRVTASGQYKFNVQDTTVANYVLTLRNHLDDIFGYNTAYNYHDMIKDIWSRIGGNSSSSANIIDLILQLNQSLIYTIGGETYTIGDLLYRCYINSNTISNKLTTTNNYLSNISSNSDLIENSISSIGYKLNTIDNIEWIDAGNLIGYSKTFSNFQSIPTTNTLLDSNIYYFKFSHSDFYGKLPGCIRLYIPVRIAGVYGSINNYIKDINVYPDPNTNSPLYNISYDWEIDNHGYYIYLWNFTPLSTYDITVKIEFNIPSWAQLYLYQYRNDGLDYINYDTKAYHTLIDTFYLKKQQKSLSGIDKLAEVYASDDLIQAKQNQQAYEDEVVADFTGSGSGASTTNDKNGLKSVSSNIKSGLNTGGSINNALGIFNTSNSLWQFFTTTTQNNVDTRSGSNSRSINLRDSNDTILDFQTERDREYYSHLGE